MSFIVKALVWKKIKKITIRMEIFFLLVFGPHRRLWLALMTVMTSRRSSRGLDEELRRLDVDLGRCRDVEVPDVPDRLDVDDRLGDEGRPELGRRFELDRCREVDRRLDGVDVLFDFSLDGRVFTINPSMLMFCDSSLNCRYSSFSLAAFSLGNHSPE